MYMLFNNIYIYILLFTFHILPFDVGKFRPRLIELTSFKLKLLIRFIMNKPC